MVGIEAVGEKVGIGAVGERVGMLNEGMSITDLESVY